MGGRKTWGKKGSKKMVKLVHAGTGEGTRVEGAPVRRQTITRSARVAPTRPVREAISSVEDIIVRLKSPLSDDERESLVRVALEVATRAPQAPGPFSDKDIHIGLVVAARVGQGANAFVRARVVSRARWEGGEYDGIVEYRLERLDLEGRTGALGRKPKALGTKRADQLFPVAALKE